MRDIVIRGIEMPKGKPLNLSIYPNGEVVLFCIKGRDVYDNECNYGDYKHKKIAVELLPHGDLKDTNVILQHLNRLADEFVPVSVGEIIDYISEQPVVLEASE